MVTDRTTNKNKAGSIEEMQQIARNQIQAKIYEMEERVSRLKNLLPQVESVVDWPSYEQAIADVEEYGDDKGLDAIHELGEYHGCMLAGGYF